MSELRDLSCLSRCSVVVEEIAGGLDVADGLLQDFVEIADVIAI